MIQISASDLKANLDKYLTLAAHEEIHITKNGSEIAVLISPKTNSSWVDELTGIISGADVDPKNSRRKD